MLYIVQDTLKIEIMICSNNIKWAFDPVLTAITFEFNLNLISKFDEFISLFLLIAPTFSKPNNFLRALFAGN